MKKTNTFAFILKWLFIEFIAGIASFIIGACFMVINVSSEKNIELLNNIASPLIGFSSWIGLGGVVAGAYLVWSAWRKASNLRKGR